MTGPPYPKEAHEGDKVAHKLRASGLPSGSQGTWGRSKADPAADDADPA